ncbi:MAG: hypothetical protein WAL85_21040 [Candidatus Korobacteraceae bacterium]
MKRLSYFLVVALLAAISGCGGSNTTPANVGLFGKWNVVMYANGGTTPTYVFALAMSQLGGSNYSGSSITYNGSVAIPSNMCINGNALSATASTSGNNFTMTVTDTTTQTLITVQGSLVTQTTTLSGTYNNLASSACPASTGTVTMSPQ